MCSFFSVWALLNPQGEYKRRYNACQRLWASYEPEMQQRVYTTLCEAMQRGERVSPNPYFAIEDTALRLQRPRATLSYADYYARYGTTEEQDGWKRINPTGEKVIYIKTN